MKSSGGTLVALAALSIGGTLEAQDGANYREPPSAFSAERKTLEGGGFSRIPERNGRALSSSPWDEQEEAFQRSARPRAEPAAAGRVSIRRLAHKPPKTARKEFEKGIRALGDDKPAEARQRFEKAVGLDPDYAEAHAKLGTLLARLNEPELALVHLEQALAMEPNWAAVHSNVAYTLLVLHHPKEAEQAARRSLELDAEAISTHYLLGLSLFHQGKWTEETAQRLAQARVKHPEAANLEKTVRESLTLAAR